MGYKGYLVGGGVRDLLVGRKPKDFDVATDARPNRLKRIFRNCRIIGRRFRLAHIFFPDNQIIEVTTFRKGSEFAEKKEDGLILRDNTFGTPEEDAVRRDLTINGLFYDISDFSVIDFVGGVEDLKKKIVRTIADPFESFREDPVRMIRAIRHAARMGFTIEERTLEALRAEKRRILAANPSRLLEELFKDLRGGESLATFRAMEEFGLLRELLPELSEQLASNPDPVVWKRLAALDALVEKGRDFGNSVLLSVLLGSVLVPRREDENKQDLGREIQTRLRPIVRRFRVSRRDCERMGQILLALRRLAELADRPNLPVQFRKKHYMNDALDLFEILRKAEGEVPAGLRRWKQQVEASDKLPENGEHSHRPRHPRHQAPAEHGQGDRPGHRSGERKRRRRRPPRHRRPPDQADAPRVAQA